MSIHSTLSRATLWATAVFSISSVGAEAQSADAFVALDAASEHYAGIEALCADFRQVLSVPLLGERREGSGRLCQQRPNLFSMRFEVPQGDLIVVDGAYGWVYTPSQDTVQVLRTPMSRIGRGLDLHREFLEEPRAKYEARDEGVEVIDGLSLRRVTLLPRLEASYVKAVVWIDAERRLLRRVEIHEENGSTRLVELSAIETDHPVPPDTFDFLPPPGTQVITR